MVLRQGLRLTSIGIGIGLAGVIALTRYIEAMLYGITPLDPLTYVATVALAPFPAVWEQFHAAHPAREAARLFAKVLGQLDTHGFDVVDRHRQNASRDCPRRRSHETEAPRPLHTGRRSCATAARGAGCARADAAAAAPAARRRASSSTRWASSRSIASVGSCSSI